MHQPKQKRIDRVQKVELCPIVKGGEEELHDKIPLLDVCHANAHPVVDDCIDVRDHRAEHHGPESRPREDVAYDRIGIVLALGAAKHQEGPDRYQD